MTARKTSHGAPREARRRGRPGRFSTLSLDELKALFVATIGRATESTDRRYLEWKIREATHGRVRVGPALGARHEPQAMMTLPWRLPRATVGLIDDARARLGMHTRAQLLASALVELLERRGEQAAADAVRAEAAANERRGGA